MMCAILPDFASSVTTNYVLSMILSYHHINKKKKLSDSDQFVVSTVNDKVLNKGIMHSGYML